MGPGIRGRKWSFALFGSHFRLPLALFRDSQTSKVPHLKMRNGDPLEINTPASS